MGAKTAILSRRRRGGFKCDICNRVTLSEEGLIAHRKTVHGVTLKAKERRRIVMKGKPRVVKKPAKKTTVTVSAKAEVEQPKPKLKVHEIAKGSDSIEPPKSFVSKPKTNNSGVKCKEERKVEFKCPQCEISFPMFFSAMRHIRKNHCFNIKGAKVAPYSQDIIQPILTEICRQCNMKYTDTHECPEGQTCMVVAQSYKCVGCQNVFSSLKMFDIHISEVHCDNVESMFFPTNEEFTAWKRTMESNTKTNYLVMCKHSWKQIYHCSYFALDPENAQTTHFCPSTIVVQEFTKGIQVHFYKEHNGHSHEKYVLTEQYKSYSLTDLLHKANEYPNIAHLNGEENDLYMEFKSVMESIILDSSKVNVDTLKTLLGQALEMTSVLTNYNKDDKTNKMSPSNVLTNKSYAKTPKRKVGIETEDTIKKKPAPDVQSPILQKVKRTRSSFSLADEKDTKEILKELDVDKEKKNKDPDINNAEYRTLKTNVMKPINQSPSSFNDSYKDFIVKSCKKEVKKNIVKTKIGQFKPSLSPKKTGKNSPMNRISSGGKANDVKYEVKERENDCNILILKM